MPGFRHTPIKYPEQDGVPLGETETHVHAILHLLAALCYHFNKREDVYVGADMLLYYEEGEPSQVVVPDVFVAIGAEKRVRRTYKLWEEEVGPTVVIEVTSKSSRTEDLGSKRYLYERLGVLEYYVFDPLGEYLSPPLTGFVREQDILVPLSKSEGGVYHSSTLGLDLVPEGSLLRLRFLDSGDLIPTMEEGVRRAEQEARRAEGETRRRRDAESEVARLSAELELLRSKG